jgi:hypothetical protein
MMPSNDAALARIQEPIDGAKAPLAERFQVRRFIHAEGAI